jgi:hypothetical protein
MTPSKGIRPILLASAASLVAMATAGCGDAGGKDLASTPEAGKLSPEAQQRIDSMHTSYAEALKKAHPGKSKARRP